MPGLVSLNRDLVELDSVHEWPVYRAVFSGLDPDPHPVSGDGAELDSVDCIVRHHSLEDRAPGSSAVDLDGNGLVGERRSVLVQNRVDTCGSLQVQDQPACSASEACCSVRRPDLFCAAALNESIPVAIEGILFPVDDDYLACIPWNTRVVLVLAGIVFIVVRVEWATHYDPGSAP